MRGTCIIREVVLYIIVDQGMDNKACVSSHMYIARAERGIDWWRLAKRDLSIVAKGERK